MDDLLHMDPEISHKIVQHVCNTVDPAKVNESLEGQQVAVFLLTSKLHKTVPCEFAVFDCKKVNCFSPDGMSARMPCMKHYELLRLMALEGFTEYMASCMPLASPTTRQRGHRWFQDVPSRILNCAYRECLLFEMMCYAKGLSNLNLYTLANGLRELAEQEFRPYVEKSTMHSCGYDHKWREGVKPSFWRCYTRALYGSMWGM